MDIFVIILVIIILSMIYAFIWSSRQSPFSWQDVINGRDIGRQIRKVKKREDINAIQKISMMIILLNKIRDNHHSKYDKRLEEVMDFIKEYIDYDKIMVEEI